MKLLLLFTGILLLAAYGDYGKIDYAYWGALLVVGSVVMASWNPNAGEGEESESEFEIEPHTEQNFNN